MYYVIYGAFDNLFPNDCQCAEFLTRQSAIDFAIFIGWRSTVVYFDCDRTKECWVEIDLHIHVSS